MPEASCLLYSALSMDRKSSRSTCMSKTSQSNTMHFLALPLCLDDDRQTGGSYPHHQYSSHGFSWKKLFSDILDAAMACPMLAAHLRAPPGGRVPPACPPPASVTSGSFAVLIGGVPPGPPPRAAAPGSPSPPARCTSRFTAASSTAPKRRSSARRRSQCLRPDSLSFAEREAKSFSRAVRGRVSWRRVRRRPAVVALTSRVSPAIPPTKNTMRSPARRSPCW
mmetsp:Transcript_10185/g.28712  ORF Transcript_10185/g.28712 Transcript_10185/m.28712 type:complete len:223 (+) Transcript_10185:770-1438(+)